MTQSNTQTRTDPVLWEACKAEVVEHMGKFSARAMQRAVVLYKKRGGGYLHEKSKDNSLVKWAKKEQMTKMARDDSRFE